jgi:hypothetical protein
LFLLTTAGKIWRVPSAGYQQPEKMEEFPMKKLALLSLFAGLASVALLTHVQASNRNGTPLTTPPQVQNDSTTCSNETLEGTYGISISGTRPAPPPPSGIPNYVPGTIEQVIGVDTRTFDGHGNFTQISNEKGSLSGIAVPNSVVHGTYNVNPDCSGTTTLHIPGVPFAVVLDIVVVNHGNEFRGIVASPQPVMVSSNGRKVN